MSALPTVTVGVPCYQEAAGLPGLAAALAALDPAPDAVLIVDDGSTDGTAEAARGLGLDVVTHPRNLGLAVARNTLWRASRTDLVAFLDADTRPPPDWLARVTAAFAAADVAGVGGWNRDAPGPSAADRFRHRFWPQWGGPERDERAAWLVGACATYRRAALEAVGGFDPGFRTHGEDVEIGLRLNAAGSRLLYDPELQVTHVRRDDSRSLAKMCFRHCLWGGRASALHGRALSPLAAAIGRVALRAPASLLVRGRDPAGAGMAVLGCAAGLAGYAVASATRVRRPPGRPAA